MNTANSQIVGDREAAVIALQARFGAQLTRADALRQQHANTVTGLEEQWPDAVLFAQSRDDVVTAVEILAAHKCPVIPFGIGTSLEGQVNAPRGGVCIDLSRMDAIIEVNQTDMVVRVQPGVTRQQLNEYLRDTGLFFPIDPGANATLGGMAATRASGTNAVRYGTMRDAVMGLEVVLPNAQLIRTGGQAKKSAAGYDLTRLMIGSEGTLGIMTELTIRLHGIPEVIAGGICSFNSIGDACRAVATTIQSGIPVARIELLDTMQVRACNGYSGYDFPETPLLLLEFHGSAQSVDEQSNAFTAIAEAEGAGEFIWSSDTDERNKLWQVRHDAYWASLSLIPGSQGLTTDVCVPLSRLAECVEATQADIEAAGLTAPIVGHVGDGNFHCLPLVPPDQPEMVKTIQEFSKRLSSRAIAMGGTCTGEHGIGQGKMDYLVEKIGEAIGAMRAIKQAFDPDNIFNPDKIFSR
jgi:D-lactate dehydrogenase (cytochrome)